MLGDRLVTETGIETHTQDFVMISNPFFFTGNPSTYVALLRTLPKPASALLEWVFTSAFPPQVATLFKAGLLAFQGTTVTNPAKANFFSTTPYRIGNFDDRAYK